MFCWDSTPVKDATVVFTFVPQPKNILVNWLTDRRQFSDGFSSPPGDGGGGSDGGEVVFKDFGGGLDDLCVVAAIVVGSEHSGGVNSRDAIGDQSPAGPSNQTNLNDMDMVEERLLIFTTFLVITLMVEIITIVSNRRKYINFISKGRWRQS